MPNDLIYRIRKVRLINFHNFVDETVSIQGGGHLFLLGDNGSGKTTLLDAVHLVLSANEDVEFNAAARVAGSSRDGRRLQGIIMRQNIETAAPLNPQGGITYAALEIDGWQGKPLCLALGMEAHAVDEQVRYWGVVRSCYLEELPLFVERGEESYPASRREIRDLLTGNGFCPDLKSYRQELVRRLYGNEGLFKETCRLLRMGKAYREIAAGTGDYHDLFKKLLPDPQRDLFERVIRTLRELDQSVTDLAGLEEKQHYLEMLTGLVEQIDRHRETALRYNWLVHYLTRQNLLEETAECENEIAVFDGELTLLQEESVKENDRLDDLQRQLGVLQGADASGLLTLQKERVSEEQRLRNDYLRHQELVKQCEREFSASERSSREAFQQWQDQLKRLYETFHRLRSGLPFSISGLLANLDNMQRLNDIRDASDLDVEEVAKEAQHALTDLAAENAAVKRSLAERRETLSELDAEIAALVTQEEIVPPVEGFREACKALERQLIEFKSLYRELEWRPGLSSETRNAIEEAVGPEILATLMVSAADYENAARTIFSNYPGIRLSNMDEAREAPPGWMLESFDIQKSHPTAIRVLAEEMCAARHPAVRKHDNATILGFRSHERRLQDRQSTLVGAERRREALRRQIQTLTERKKDVAREIRDCEKIATDQASLRDSLNILAQALLTGPLNLANTRHAASKAFEHAVNTERRLSSQHALLDDADSRLKACREQLTILKARIDHEGLDKLESKLRTVTREIELVNQRIGDLKKREGVLSERIAEHQRRQNILRMQITSEEESLKVYEVRLQPAASSVESVSYYVLRTWRGQQFGSVDNVQSELERVRHDEAVAVGTLRTEVNHPTYGSLYAFNYDEAANQLVDRHVNPIRDVAAAGQQQIDEQREVINERTQELIRNIIMGDLFTELRRSVRRLRDMVREINHLLSDRIFGTNRYRFRLEEEKRYRDLLNVIERYNPLDPKAHDDLKHFLELHKDEIMATEVNDIPAVLDYRNWFIYELMMMSETDNGEVVMNRKTKSLGSGGEQAVPNYLLILTVARFLYDGNNDLRTRVLLFDEAFYGIDTGRRDQLLGFASDLGLQLFVASPDLDGVKQEIPCSTTLLVVKDDECNVHLFACDFTNPQQLSLMDGAPDMAAAEFGTELGGVNA